MLDYDVLLLIRVADYRYSVMSKKTFYPTSLIKICFFLKKNNNSKGVPHRLSVIKGVAKTGGIITAAGAIMAVAFSGFH